MFPPTIKRRTTTNLKTNNNQNFQRIKLDVSQTIKELKKKDSSRLVGKAETGSWGGEAMHQGGNWWTGRSHICMWINCEEQLGSETDCTTPDSRMVK